MKVEHEPRRILLHELLHFVLTHFFSLSRSQTQFLDGSSLLSILSALLSGTESHSPNPGSSHLAPLRDSEFREAQHFSDGREFYFLDFRITMSPFVAANSTLSPCFSWRSSTISFGIATRRLLPILITLRFKTIGIASQSIDTLGYPRDTLI